MWGLEPFTRRAPMRRMLLLIIPWAAAGRSSAAMHTLAANAHNHQSCSGKNTRAARSPASLSPATQQPQNVHHAPPPPDGHCSFECGGRTGCNETQAVLDMPHAPYRAMLTHALEPCVLRASTLWCHCLRHPAGQPCPAAPAKAPSSSPALTTVMMDAP
jgi:hypothetical protein